MHPEAYATLNVVKHAENAKQRKIARLERCYETLCEITDAEAGTGPDFYLLMASRALVHGKFMNLKYGS